MRFQSPPAVRRWRDERHQRDRGYAEWEAGEKGGAGGAAAAAAVGAAAAAFAPAAVAAAVAAPPPIEEEGVVLQGRAAAATARDAELSLSSVGRGVALTRV